MRFTLFLALRHLSARLRSTLLIFLGVGIGVFVMTVMQSMMFGFQGRAVGMLLTVTPSVLVKGRERGFHREGRVYGGAEAELYDQARLRPAQKEKGIRNYRLLDRRIRTLPGVVAVAPVVQGRALVTHGTRESGVSLFGVYAPDYDKVIEFGSKVTGDVDDLVRRRDGVILGTLLAEELGTVIGSRVRMAGSEGSSAGLRVVALFASGIRALDERAAFVNLSMGQALLGYPGAATTMAIKADEGVSTPALARRIEFATGLECQSWPEINANFFAIMRQQNGMTFGAVGLTILVAGFGIANGLVTVVLEKRRDIGILRALGVTPRGIARVFVVEGVLMCLVGAAVGMLAASWAIAQMSHLPIRGGGFSAITTFPMLYEPRIYVTSGVFALLVSLFASLFPALRAAKYDPVEIIRTAK